MLKLVRPLLFALLPLVPMNVAGGAEFRFSTGECNNCLYMIGEIVDGDFERFKGALKSYAKQNGPEFVPLTLRSGGGNVVEAINIGRLARELYMNVTVPFEQKTFTRDYRGVMGRCDRERKFFRREVPCLCGSACVLIFWAGAFRGGTELYIHRISYRREYFMSLSPVEAERQYRQGMETIRSYLDEMGIDDKWYHRMLRTESGKVEKIPFQEALQFAEPIPAIEEWMTAKCGPRISAAGQMEAYMRREQCRHAALEAPRKEVYQRLLAE